MLFKQITNLIQKTNDDDTDKMRAIQLLATVQALYGDKAASQANFKKAKKDLDKNQLSEDDRVVEYQDLAMAMIVSGFWRDALEIAESLQKSKRAISSNSGEKNYYVNSISTVAKWTKQDCAGTC